MIVLVLVQTTLEGARLEVDRLKVSLDEFKKSITEAETALRRYISLARRFGFPEDIMGAIAKALQMITVLRSLYRTLMLLTAATTPLGFISALGGVGVATFAAADIMMLEVSSH